MTNSQLAEMRGRLRAVTEEIADPQREPRARFGADYGILAKKRSYIGWLIVTLGGYRVSFICTKF